MWMDVLPASKGRSYLREQFSKPLLALMGIVAAGAADRVLQPGESAGCPRHGAAEGDRGPARPRCQPRPPRSASLLLESVLLSVAGGAAGVALAVFGSTRRCSRFLPASVAALTLSATPDWRVLRFTLVVSLFTGLVFGLAARLQATRPQLASTLKDQAGAVVGGAAVALRKGLVVAQVALSLLLLIGAGLFLQSLNNLKELTSRLSNRDIW